MVYEPVQRSWSQMAWLAEDTLGKLLGCLSPASSSP